MTHRSESYLFFNQLTSNLLHIAGEPRFWIDRQWNFRHMRHRAHKFYETVAASGWVALRSKNQDEDEDGRFSEDLQWENLVVNLDGTVRLSNKFSFSVASLYHAGETCLLPDLFKGTWVGIRFHDIQPLNGGGAPVAPSFVRNFEKKREAYHGSESALCILNEHGIQVVRKISTFKQTSEEQSRPCVKGAAGALLRLQPPPGARIRHVGTYECSGTWALDWELKGAELSQCDDGMAGRDAISREMVGRGWVRRRACCAVYRLVLEDWAMS
ncbi:hypothetical protein D9619_012901 [Psilocybe cf. subviscida]|uniref:Uncharacterized protein n=1 Tax=Psilocybe cf. subviscida TaxID=2480587 RepID=A0A8H5BIM4_9AGAR|nr:hypothetical protein D9619_012901 [Psilocybe cf. subviscida]